MTIQLQLNQGPQDALLFDNNRSFFASTGYVRTSNFQMEYRDVDPQNTAKWNSTTTFVIPQAGDLLGNVDLLLEAGVKTKMTATSADADDFVQWVNKLGYAAIDEIRFTVGQQDIQTITGRQLELENEFMRDPDYQYGDMIGDYGSTNAYPDTDRGTAASGASVGGCEAVGQSLIIPLGLFFSKHPSAYFPLAAVATCNEVKITIKWRDWKHLYQRGDAALVDNSPADSSVTEPSIDAQLRCHFVHVTGVEAQTLAQKEHVRLLTLTQRQSENFTVASGADKILKVNLNFLHPVKELFFVIRRVSDEDKTLNPRELDYFAREGVPSTTITAVNTTMATQAALDMKSWRLLLNGQSRHPMGISGDYTQRRLLPLHHSNGYGQAGTALDNIFVIPLALNPEGQNPSGSVNFSKVAHAQLELTIKAGTYASAGTNTTAQSGEYVVDIYGSYYNWLAIKDGRALLSFS